MVAAEFAYRLGHRLSPHAVNLEERQWRRTARPEQLPPENWEREWYVRGSRAGGKTWTGSNNLADLILSTSPGEWGVVAPTFGDARDTCVESLTSGLMVALDAKIGPGGRILDRGPHVRDWNRSMGQLYLTNGSVVFCDGGDDGALRIQGKNLRGCWVDEVGLLRRWETAWDESIQYAVRIPPALIIVTGTPKANMPARRLVKRLLDDDTIPKSLLLMSDNVDNLDRATVGRLMKLKGTRLARQELMGEFLEDVPGALWTLELIEQYRVTSDEVPEMVRIVVGVDPAVSSGEDADATGIVVVGKGVDGHGYVLDDRTIQGVSPATWGKRAIDAYHDWQADRVVAEVNNGGDLVIEVLKGIDASVPVEKVHASRGKTIRAEPVSTAYEQGLVHHVGSWVELEDQMASYQPDSPRIPGEKPRRQDSPDRMDALVWACRKLGIMFGGSDWGNLYDKPGSEIDEVRGAEGRAARGWARTYAHPDTERPSTKPGDFGHASEEDAPKKPNDYSDNYRPSGVTRRSNTWSPSGGNSWKPKGGSKPWRP